MGSDVVFPVVLFSWLIGSKGACLVLVFRLVFSRYEDFCFAVVEVWLCVLGRIRCDVCYFVVRLVSPFLGG